MSLKMEAVSNKNGVAIMSAMEEEPRFMDLARWMPVGLDMSTLTYWAPVPRLTMSRTFSVLSVRNGAVEEVRSF